MQRKLPIHFLTLVAFLGWAAYGMAQTPAMPGAPSAVPPAASQPAMGPKKRIAVLKFDAGSLATQYGGADIGNGLAAELTTALLNSGQFIVIERAELANILREQEMSMQKLVSGETAAQVGRLLGAQLLVRASVTEFDQRTGGGGVRIGVGTAATTGGLGIATNTGVVGIEVRLIDTTTGQVVQSHHAEAKVEDRGISADVGVRAVNFGADSFQKSPLGRATRQAIDQATAFVIAATRPLVWTGRVVDVSGDQIFVSAGADAGIRPGDKFVVSTVVRELTDPASGALLGVIENPLGDIEIVNVQDRFSVARMSAPFQTKRGDLVRSAAR
jgi:curli biogenesis system outer membrane secretion channel CsgG